MTRTDWMASGGVLLLLLVVALAVGFMHDYSLYLHQWRAILAGGDPWAAQFQGREIPFNAYGPLHAAFALPYGLHPLAPKAIFACLCAVVFALCLVEARGGRPGAQVDHRRLALLFPLAPAVIIAIPAFGNNDIVPASLTFLALMAHSRGLRTVAGLCIGLGALVKFYPLLFAAFFALNRGRLDLRVPLVALGVFLAGMGLAYAVWGDSVLAPFLFGSGREAKMLSVLRFLRSVEVVEASALYAHLLDRNALYALGAVALVGLHAWRARWPWELAVLLGTLSVFVTYKVGHPQFFVSWLAVQAWILARRPDPEAVLAARALLPVSVYLSLFQVTYLVSRLVDGAYLANGWFFVREYGSLPFLACVAWGLWRARAVVFRRWRRPAGWSL
ncbi:hypothetical protein AIOL_003943 [Candidatus Rhodobacter oscarellae]|uniref:DUF2029 domain-containing protein n=1 Tax=Candidatus Rhodobacter oscarellae TaxID=1675527 RepID=A0A0J9E8A5_9RHOB|nr:glycosyltransferase family 87 protein [Candidatus Rhodobacter lobularis]KMW58962.1 hypothetical protein AIOL_003943 [Candidatus Rhodobacter lobularis]